ncbi:MAG: DUF3037 domain-containing protein [Chitinophagaceae bacterium]
MIKIQYQILRYMPDRVSGEFVNLGIVVFDPETQSLKSKFINRIGKISSFFPGMNSRYLIKSVKFIQDQMDILSARLMSEFLFEKKSSLDSITMAILPKDDSSLFFSEVKKMLDIHVESTINNLFTRFVKVHVEDEEDDEVRRDKEVWSKVYKKHFDEYGISGYFHSHKVKTQNDEVEFDKSWKNGSLNCLESVSFNLSRPDIIKNKVYKWVGKLEELNSSQEQLNIYLLSVLPHDHPELTNFINKKIKSKSTANTQVFIISENEIEVVAKEIKSKIEAHL